MKISAGCLELSAEDVGELMMCNTSDPWFQILDDDELTKSVVEESV